MATTTEDEWNLKELRSYTSTLGEKSEAMSEVVDSIGEYVDIFGYHLAEARDAMKGIVYEDDPDGRKNMLYLTGKADRQSEFERATLKSSASSVEVCSPAA